MIKEKSVSPANLFVAFSFTIHDLFLFSMGLAITFCCNNLFIDASESST